MDDVHCYIYMFPDNFQRTTLIMYFFQLLNYSLEKLFSFIFRNSINYHTNHSILLLIVQTYKLFNNVIPKIPKTKTT